jgi:predicted O-linked N-acetylglucosamine transferase (SPINDLY family)
MNKIDLAIAEHNKNNIQIAEKLYKEIIDHDEPNEVALMNLSIIYAIKKLNNEAIELIEKAFNINPKNPEINLMYARLLNETGKYELSEIFADRSIQLGLRNERSFFWKGLAEEKQGKIIKAKNSYEKALLIKEEINVRERHNKLPKINLILQSKENTKKAEELYVSAVTYAKNGEWLKALYDYSKLINKKKIGLFYSERSIVRNKIGDEEGALEDAEKALVIDKKNGAIWTNYGLLLKEKNRLVEAEKCFRKAVNLSPRLFECSLNLGSLLLIEDKIEEALIYINNAKEINKNSSQVYNNLAIYFLKKGEPDNGIENALVAIKLNVQNYEAKETYADLLAIKGETDLAIEELEKLKILSPGRNTIWATLAYLYMCKYDYNNAFFNYMTAVNISGSTKEKKNVAISAAIFFTDNGMITQAKSLLEEYEASNDILVLNALANLYSRMGLKNKSIEKFKESLIINPKQWTAHSMFLFNAAYGGWLSAQEMYDEAMRFEINNIPSELIRQKKIFTNSKNLNRKIKIGYISGDFNKHAVSYFIKEVLRNHNKEKFIVNCYHTSSRVDEITQEIKTYVDKFSIVNKLTNKSIYDEIKKDEIDVLIDLSGHTSNHRLMVLAMKPSPVQCHYLGYMSTTGISSIDYWITDKILHPENTEELFVEKLWRLDRTWIAYSNYNTNPEIINQNISTTIYGCFNNYKKMNSQLFDCWIKLLSKDKESFLYLKNRDFNDELQRESVIKYFESKGIDNKRLIIGGGQTSSFDHLNEYNKIDCCLDTFPFNGGTTTSDALSMGVPVITLAGKTMSTRMGASLLASIGRNNWIASTEDDYIEKAIEISKCVKMNKIKKENIKEDFNKSPATNVKELTLNLEKSYLEMFSVWVKE